MSASTADIICTQPHPVSLTDASFSALQHLIQQQFADSQIWILVDSNTLQYCYPKLLTAVPELQKAELIEVEPGEASKDLMICQHVWSSLSEAKADRKSLLLTLGGGVVSDLGGFIAAVYKRGIACIHLPTSLLAMVDAAIGGKTGIDFLGFKNQLGAFHLPQAVIIYPGFLESLPPRELRSGMAEVLKHALIADDAYWEQINASENEAQDWKHLIRVSVDIKMQIVAADPKEQNKRRLLNFGHTIGHAIESQLLAEGSDIRHGEAIAAGMIAEAYLSQQYLDFSEEALKQLAWSIRKRFPLIDVSNKTAALVGWMHQDKKNIGERMRMSLLQKIGEGVIDIEVKEADIAQAMLYYQKVYDESFTI